MTEVPLGRGAYERLYSGSPEIQLQNRWLEANPANLREGSSVLARPGTTPLMSLNPGSFVGFDPIRGNYALNGLFEDSLFVVCGGNLYRVNQDMSVIHILGYIDGINTPEVAWQKGSGYERLWISDGFKLQFYNGTSFAIGVLDTIGAIVNGTDVFEVGGVYYTWGTTFLSTDAGTISNPYVVNPTPVSGPVNHMGQLVLAVMNSGISGTDYSCTITSPHPLVRAEIDTGVLSVTITDGGHGYLDAPRVIFTSDIPGDGDGAEGVATVAGGAVTAVTITEPGSGYANPPIVSFVGGDGSCAEGTAVLAASNAAVLFTALVAGVAGNTITLSISGGSGLVTSGATLINGGLNTLHICDMPDDVMPSTISQVSSYVLVGVTNTQKFFWIDPGETAIDPLNFASKESSPDPILHIRAVGDQLLILGEKSTENWYATGNLAAPFAPIEGRVYARGALYGTPVVIDDGVFLVGDDGRVYSIGFQPGDGTDAGWGVQRISNNGIEERVRRQIRREAGLTP